jgi:hypothetical protein
VAQKLESLFADGRVERRAMGSVAALGLCVLLCVLLSAAASAIAQPAPAPTWRMQARVVAVGLPGVAGVREVGRFHSGGPIPSNPEFLLRTEAGGVLQAQRVLVATASNFGAPRAAGDQAEGAVLSIDPRQAQTLVIPGRFAARAPVALSGAVQLYSAQSPAFLNRRHNPSARTAALAAVAGPRYLSINNGFGRPWIANAPAGAHGEGSLSVTDPNGAPLDNAPSAAAGGVFAGRITQRESMPRVERTASLFTPWFNQRASAQLTPGALRSGALGTALLGPSPDGSGLAVFAVVTADGAVSQVHVQDGVDGLAPPGTIAPGSSDPGVIGVAFKWNPQRALYVADAARDGLVVLHLGDDGRHFSVMRSEALQGRAFRQPVDVAPAVPEVANPRFASHTTLAGASDLYVANRGDGTLLRIDPHGRVLARATIELPGAGALGADRLRALAVSGDAQRLWVTLSGEVDGFAGHEGALLEVPAFDAAGPFAPMHAAAPSGSAAQGTTRDGARIFGHAFAPSEGLGPLFNARACITCHGAPTVGGMSSADEHFGRRVAHMDPVSGRVSPVSHSNAPLARRHSTRELGRLDAPAAELPRRANVVSLRMPPALYAIGTLDDIPDAAIEAHAIAKGDGIKGRVHRVTASDGQTRIGRYGWKADIATLDAMVADAFANELGITSAATPPGDGASEGDSTLVRAVVVFLRGLRVPTERVAP